MFIAGRTISAFDQCTLKFGVQRPRGRRQLPHPREAWGIIDTGATASMISAQLYREVGLETFIPVLVESPGHEHPAKAHQTIADLAIFGDDPARPCWLRTMPLVVARGTMRGQILLGMDALLKAGARLQIDGARQSWNLDIPNA